MIIKIAIAVGVLVSAALLMKKKDMTYRQSILKTIYPAIMWSTGKAGSKQVQVNADLKKGTVEFYSLTTKDIAGNAFSFEQFKGKKVLIVNTASDCGYTGQYENLEKLAKQFSGSLVVVMVLVCLLVMSGRRRRERSGFSADNMTQPKRLKWDWLMQLFPSIN